jgi:hypothetical protein
MSPSCCGIRGLRRLRIGNSEVGLTGVDATMEFLYGEGWSPEGEDLGKTFVQRLREMGNYIPADQEPLYAPALIELFREFYHANAAGNTDARRGRRR